MARWPIGSGCLRNSSVDPSPEVVFEFSQVVRIAKVIDRGRAGRSDQNATGAVAYQQSHPHGRGVHTATLRDCANLSQDRVDALVGHAARAAIGVPGTTDAEAEPDNWA
jgi:hypothetical protein